MRPEERILAVLDRSSVDRLPVDLWCTPEVLDALREHTGLDDELAVYDALGLDKIVWVFPGYGGRYFDPNDAGETTLWGVRTRRVRSGSATYDEYVGFPLAGMEEAAQLDGHPWPEPEMCDYAASSALADRARSFGFATIGPWVSFFEIYCQMRGLEDALVDTLANEDFLDAALDRIEGVQTAMMERFFDDLGDRIDLVFISDDLGTQNSQLMSLEAWEAHLKPRLRRWCELAHRHGKKVLYHSDGACAAFIPGLIECGVDVFNPIQHVCPGMDMARLKDDFGDALVFHGGVENQRILPFGTPEEVARETRECLETLGRDGKGYIVCSCHNAQAGTPTENILAMIETVKTHGGGI